MLKNISNILQKNSEESYGDYDFGVIATIHARVLRHHLGFLCLKT